MNEKLSRRAIDGKVKKTFHACAKLSRIISVHTTYTHTFMRGIRELHAAAR